MLPLSFKDTVAAVLLIFSASVLPVIFFLPFLHLNLETFLSPVSRFFVNSWFDYVRFFVISNTDSLLFEIFS